MNPEAENLIEDWCDGSLDEDGQRELMQWLREDPQRMQHFVEANAREQMLCEVASSLFIESAARVAVTKPVRDHDRSWKQVTTIVASLAACLLIALGWLATRSNDEATEVVLRESIDQPQPKLAFAFVAAAENAIGSFNVGDRLAADTIELKSGLLRLQFDDGVEVTLQGPAKYELISLGRTRLHFGLFSATVPPGAEGFQVDTPTAEVVDLGTVFGVEVDRDGTAEVLVFDGEVEVQRDGQNEKLSIKEGQAVRVGKATSVESIEFDETPYEKVWPIASGIAGSSGAFRFAPPWPRPMGLVQSNTEIFVFPEGYPLTLDRPLSVDITTSGEHRAASELSADVLPVGTRVKSFLLQFRPLERGDTTSRVETKLPDPEKLKRIVGEITFDQNVLGLIVTGSSLRSSDGRFSVRGGQVPQKGRALELNGTPRDDVVSLSEDRRTVKLDLAAFGVFADQVRVVVDGSLEN